MTGFKNIIDSFWTFVDDYIVFPISNFDPIIDLLDIIILSILLYLVYRFVRDRRAGKLVIGVVFLVLIFILSQALGMQATNVIFKNFYTAGLIALVVIFQPELRDALETVGNTPLKLGKRGFENGVENSEYMKAATAIADAACLLSTEGYGALMVIERSTKLGDYIEKGVPIDAKITQNLLRNIFVNKAPLHDGAVIIRNLRISAASCKLPLSSNEEMLHDLGTRHRSAVGITEVSDAVVVVVSEESGIISIACNKLIRRNYNYEDLKHDLYMLMTGGEPVEIPEDALSAKKPEQIGKE